MPVVYPRPRPSAPHRTFPCAYRPLRLNSATINLESVHTCERRDTATSPRHPLYSPNIYPFSIHAHVSRSPDPTLIVVRTVVIDTTQKVPARRRWRAHGRTCCQNRRRHLLRALRGLPSLIRTARAIFLRFHVPRSLCSRVELFGILECSTLHSPGGRAECTLGHCCIR